MGSHRQLFTADFWSIALAQSQLSSSRLYVPRTFSEFEHIVQSRNHYHYVYIYTSSFLLYIYNFCVSGHLDAPHGSPFYPMKGGPSYFQSVVWVLSHLYTMLYLLSFTVLRAGVGAIFAPFCANLLHCHLFIVVYVCIMCICNNCAHHNLMSVFHRWHSHP